MRSLFLLIALGLLAATPAAGQRAPESRAGELRSLQAEHRDEATRARRLRADAAEARAEISELERRLTALRRDVAADDVQMQAQRARLRALEVRDAALTAERARERSRHARLLSALQMMERRPPPPLLVPADRAVDTVRAAILLKAVAPELRMRAEALSARQAEAARVRRLAVLSSEALLTAESAQGDRRAEIEALSARKTALAGVLTAEARVAERAAAALEARIRALGGEIPRVVDAPAAASRRPAGRDRLTPPVSGAPATQFGQGSGGWRWSADAEAVVAPAAARVLHAGSLSGWGEVVVLDLGPGWRAVIAGLDTVSVEVGARIDDSQILGRTAPDGEVYFELRRDERPVDPAPWLR